MQCNQSFCGNGFPRFGQSYTYNPPMPCNGIYPEIIGEGEVTSLMLSDGSVQFFFTPTTKWWSPYMSQPPLVNPNNPFWNTNAGMWFVRTIVNPLPPFVSSQQCNTNGGASFPRPCFTSECNINKPPSQFHLKFHNDGCTSTSDLHYFFPSLRSQCFAMLPTKSSAAVQVQLLDPNSTTHYEQACIKPCNCTFKETKVMKCACKLSDKLSSMSIDDKELNINVKKTTHCRCPGKGTSATECACKSMPIDNKELNINVKKTTHCRCPGKGTSATECACKSMPIDNKELNKTVKKTTRCRCPSKVASATKCTCSSMSIDNKESNKTVKKTTHCRCPGKGTSVTECACKNSNTSMHGKKLKNRFKKHKHQASSSCCSSSSILTDRQKNKLKSDVRKNEPLHSCECHSLPKTTDKSVFTYTDQASGCNPEQGRETQTCALYSIPIVPPIEKFNFTGNCESDCSSSSCDCSHSCHERE